MADESDPGHPMLLTFVADEQSQLVGIAAVVVDLDFFARETLPTLPDTQHYEFGDIRIDFRHHEATKSGRTIALSSREVLLMAYLVAHRGGVLTREQLLDAVWGYDNMPFTRTVDTHVAKLRKKIEDDPANPRHLITLHRLGYKFLG